MRRSIVTSVSQGSEEKSKSHQVRLQGGGRGQDA